MTAAVAKAIDLDAPPLVTLKAATTAALMRYAATGSTDTEGGSRGQ